MSSPATGIDAALILDTAHEAFVAIDAGGAIREWNRAAETTFGWGRGEVVGRELAEVIIPPEHREAHRAGLARFLETGEGSVLDARLELPALHRDGHRLELEVTISAPVTDEGGTYFHAFLHDISHRLRRQRSLHAQLQVSEALATATPEAVPRLVLEALGAAGGWSYAGWWLADDDRASLHGYRAWSAPELDATEFESASRRLHFRPGLGLPGRAWNSGAPEWEHDLAAVPQSRRATVAARVGLHGGVAVPLKSSGRVVGVLEFFARDARGPQAGIDDMLRTVTPQIGEYLARTRAERRASELKDAFVATVSHELRTPLTSIMGFAQTALDLEHIDEATQREFLGIILGQSRRLARLVDDLLDMSRIQSGSVEVTLEALDVADVVREAVESLRAPDIEVRTAGGTSEAMADRDVCTQLVINLVDNAARYAGGATRIDVTVEDERVVLAVCDRGPGVDPSFRDHLFDRFSRASQEVPGTGLGLSIVRALAELQGGSAWYEPRRSGGSRFLVSMRRPSRRSAGRDAD